MGKSMTSPVGLNSSKGNPVSKPNTLSSQVGPGSNPDQAKVNKLMHKVHAEKESLRGKSSV